MTSRIERGITIEGSIRGEGELEVAGRVRGALTLAGKLVVEPGGIVEADVEATDIEVAGLLAGSATAHNTVQVREGGRVEARIKAQRLMVDDGALFRGELMAQGANPAEPAIGLAAPAASKGALPAPREPSRANESREPSRANESREPSRANELRGREARENDERSRDGRRRDDGGRSERGARAVPGFRAPEPPAAASAATSKGAAVARGEGAAPRAPSTGPRKSEPAGPPVMPMLPRGRTKIRVRGGES
ncbi:MAG: polymer-forming cytoskeletal protein [Polyangiales bacterium]